LGGLVFYAIFDFRLTVSMLATGRLPPAAGFVSILVLTALLYGVALLVVLPDGLLRSAPWPGRRYARAALPEAIAEAQVTALRQLMRDDEPWRSEDLDLATLAAMIDLNPHQLSQLLSQHLATSFADFVNGYRVDAAKQLLRETAGTMTMLEIGLEAGFGSSATFYRAFRRRTGATPREYLATIDSDKVVPIARGKRG
ncbi:MAG: helix-turn-helix transcriptional regulator, partial [Pseudomonadota bacterium]